MGLCGDSFSRDFNLAPAYALFAWREIFPKGSPWDGHERRDLPRVSISTSFAATMKNTNERHACEAALSDRFLCLKKAVDMLPVRLRIPAELAILIGATE